MDAKLHHPLEQQDNDLKASPARLRALIQEMCDVFWILTTTGEMQSTSSRWHTFPELQTHQAKGWLAAFHPLDHQHVDETFTESVATGQTRELTCHLRHSEHAYSLTRLRFIPVHDASGTLHEILACGTHLHQQEQATDMGEAEVQLALQASDIGTWNWNLLTGELVWTDQKRALFGLPSGTPISYERFLSTLHPDDRELTHRLNMQALEEQQEYKKDYRVIWPDGSIHWLTDRARISRDETGKPIQVIGATADITERKQAEEALRESEARFQRLREANIIGMITTDEQGNVLEANDAFLALLGYTRAELEAGQITWSTITSQQTQQRDGEAIEEALQTGVAQSHEKEYVAKDGRRIPVLIGRALFRREGVPSRFLCFVLDLTARKEAERQKDIFLGITGHELRTPLAALKVTLQLISRRLKRFIKRTDQVTPEMASFFADIQEHLLEGIRQVDIQSRLVDDLLDISRITTGTLTLSLRRCDLVSIVREAVEDLRLVTPDRQLLFETPEDASVTVMVDPTRIQQVVTNYLTNALRYSPADQPITTGIRVQNHMAHVWVRDLGPGLSKEAQEKIWQRFHQIKEVPIQSGSEKGLGLGLYLCQTLIEQHHGTVDVESTPGKGATFWFHLPLAAEDTAE